MHSLVPYETPQIKITLTHGNESSTQSRALLLLFQQSQPQPCLHWQEEGDAPGTGFAAPQGKGSHWMGPTAPQGHDVPSLPTQGEEWGNFEIKTTAGHRHHRGAEVRTRRTRRPPEAVQQGFWPKISVSFSPKSKVAIWMVNPSWTCINAWPLKRPWEVYQAPWVGCSQRAMQMVIRHQPQQEVGLQDVSLSHKSPRR